MINRTTDFRKESNSLQNSFVKFNYQNLKPMRKIVYSLMTIALLTSCNSVEKDAKKLADLMCKAQENQSNPVKSMKFVEDIEKIEDKYNDKEKKKLQKLAEKLYIKQCGEKNASDFFDSMKEESSPENNDYNNSELNSNDEFNNWQHQKENSYAQVDKLLDEYERYVTEFSLMYNSAYSGDVSAMSKYPILLDKAKKFGISLNNASAKGELNPDQIKRLDVLNGKLTDFVPGLFD